MQIRARTIGSLAAATIATVALPAFAASLSVFERSSIAGATVYRNAKISDTNRAEQLRLRPDGTLSGNWSDMRVVSGHRYEEVGQVRGRWRIEGGRLCLSGSGLRVASRGCMPLVKAGFSRREYAFTDRDGDRWQVFIHPIDRSTTGAPAKG